MTAEDLKPGDKVTFKLLPYGLGGFAVFVDDLGQGMAAVCSVPERRMVAVPYVELVKGWRNQ